MVLLLGIHGGKGACRCETEWIISLYTRYFFARILSFWAFVMTEDCHSLLLTTEFIEFLSTRMLFNLLLLIKLNRLLS